MEIPRVSREEWRSLYFGNDSALCHWYLHIEDIFLQIWGVSDSVTLLLIRSIMKYAMNFSSNFLKTYTKPCVKNSDENNAFKTSAMTIYADSVISYIQTF